MTKFIIRKNYITKTFLFYVTQFQDGTHIYKKRNNSKESFLFLRLTTNNIIVAYIPHKKLYGDRLIDKLYLHHLQIQHPL